MTPLQFVKLHQYALAALRFLIFVLAAFVFTLAYGLFVDRYASQETERPTIFANERTVLLSGVIDSIQHEYDRYRADKHGIPISIARIIRESATAEDIPLPLAFALVKLESAFIPWAVSPVGAIGLSQVMPPTGLEHCGLTANQLFDPTRNVPCGFSYLRMLHDRHDDWSVALAAYNVGDARRARAHRTGEPNGAWYATRILGGEGLRP